MDLILLKKPRRVKENSSERESQPYKGRRTRRAEPKVETAHNIGPNYGTKADAGIYLVVLQDILSEIAEHLANVYKGRKLPLHSDSKECHLQEIYPFFEIEKDGVIINKPIGPKVSQAVFAPQTALLIERPMLACS